jgi:uncharacterized protein YaaW (UPF0174 family)
MTHNSIFQVLPPAVLVEAARYLGFDPLVSTAPTGWFSSLSSANQEHWLDSHRSKLEDQFCSVGSWTFGTTKTYDQIVRDLAQKIGAAYAPGADVRTVETAIVTKLWNDAVAKMSPQQLAALREQLEDLASKYGKSLGMEFTGVAALSAAQLSGFGVYLLGSTVLGAINGALGLGLSFGAFTGLSSLISTIIGPVGWAALGLAAIVKLGAPNYKKILPVVLLIAKSRALLSENGITAAVPPPTQETPSSGKSQPKAAAPSAPLSNGRSGASQPGLTSLEPVASLELVKAVQQDIDSAVRRKAKEAAPAEPRKLSKLERSIFKLKNPEHYKMAETLEVDYLDLSPSAQESIQQMVAMDKAIAEKSAADAKRELRKERKAKNRSQKPSAETESGKRKCLKSKRAEYRQLLENLEFKDAALLRLCESSSEESLSFLSEFRRLNQGHFDPKCTILQTNPKVLEQEAGREGRIYYRSRSNESLTVIVLIGTKTTQEADIRRLRTGNI